MRHNTIRLILSIFVFFLVSIPAIYTFFTKGFVFAVLAFFLSSIVLALSVVIFLAIYNTVNEAVDYFLEKEEFEKKRRK